MAAMGDLSDSKREVEHFSAVGVGILFFILLTTTFVILTSDSDPSLYIQDLYVPSLAPALNKTMTFNTSIFIDLKFERAAASSCPDHADFQMTLFYSKNQGWLLVGNHVVEGFDLGQRKEFHVKAAVEAPRLPWEEASRAVSSGSKVVLMVELVVSRRPDSCDTFLRLDNVGPDMFVARVAVDASGHKASKNPIKLKYKGHLFTTI